MSRFRKWRVGEAFGSGVQDSRPIREPLGYSGDGGRYELQFRTQVSTSG